MVRHRRPWHAQKPSAPEPGEIHLSPPVVAGTASGRPEAVFSRPHRCSRFDRRRLASVGGWSFLVTALAIIVGTDVRKRRREFITLLGGAAATWPHVARAAARPDVSDMGCELPNFAPYVGITPRPAKTHARKNRMGGIEGACSVAQLDQRSALAAQTERRPITAGAPQFSTNCSRNQSGKHLAIFGHVSRPLPAGEAAPLSHYVRRSPS